MRLGDTITAIATASGRGGIGIVRISGPKALKIATAIFEPQDKNSKIIQRKMISGYLYDPEKKSLLDTCLFTFFKTPKSYTGEDVVELSCHGSPPVLKRVVKQLVTLGARPAEGGEFTYRAVLNGRIDLTQAEAIDRLIKAETLFQAEQAIKQVGGHVGEMIARFEDGLIDLVSRLEAEVDFADEGDNFVNRNTAKEQFLQLKKETSQIINRFSDANRIRDGALVVLAGKTNVGKSTLFNAILSENRAIVDPEPGTTRDFISERIEIEGIPVTLVDTAGFRDDVIGVEREGIQRSSKKMLGADLVLLISAADQPANNENVAIRKLLKRNKIDYLEIDNKIDLLKEKTRNDKVIQISALKMKGLEHLRSAISQKLDIDRLKQEASFITELRQQQLFILMADKISAAEVLYLDKAYDELVLEELNNALEKLSEISGKNINREVLQRIFSSYCIGK